MAENSISLPQSTSTKNDAPYSAFPSDFIDPSLKKEKKYNLQYCKAGYDEHVKNVQLITSTRRSDFVENRLYAEGNQSNLKYKKPFTFKDETGKKPYSFVDLDYTPVSILPGYRDIVISYLEKLEYDIDFAAIDPISDNTRNQEVYKIWADKMLSNIFQREQIQGQLTENPEEVYPETKEELEIFKNTSFKLKWEMAMKGIVDLDFYENNWPEIRRKIYEDLFDNGLAGCREFTTKEGRHVIRWSDVVNLYIRQTNDKECKNSNAIGEVIEMTLSDFVTQSEGQFTEQEYMQIARSTNPQGGSTFYDYVDTSAIQNGGWLDWYTGKFGSQRVKIFDLTWFSFDRTYYEEKTNQAGVKMIYPKPFGYKIKDYDYTSEMQPDGKMKYFRKEIGGATPPAEMSQNEWMNEVKQPKSTDRKVTFKSKKMVYGGKWVVGTDFIYDYGLQYDLPRDPMPNGKETNLPFHIYRLTNKSIVERCKPFLDSFMLAWMRIQNAKARARPKGIKIELDALENMTIGGKEFTPLQALAVYDQTGNIIYKGTGQFGEASRHSPVEEMQGGMGAEYAELINDLNFNIKMVQEVTGFNAIFLSSSPDPDQPVKTAQMAVQATNNALYPLQQALKNIHIRAVKSTMCRFQIMSKYNKLKGFEHAISEPMRKIIEFDGDLLTHPDGISPINMGIKVITRPTEEQRANIERAAVEAMKTIDPSGEGAITYPDYLFIMRILDGGNSRYAEAVLGHRIQKRKKERQQQAMMLQQQNGEIQIQSAQAAEEQKRLTLQFETDQKIRLAQAEGEIQIAIDTNKLSIQQDTAGITTKGKIIQGETAANAKTLTAVIAAENKKEVEKMKPKPKKPAAK